MRTRAPLFLARAVYRRRRLRDAARLLPLLGLLLVMLPALGGPADDTGAAAVYLFVVWALLIMAAAALAPGLSAPEAEPPGFDPPDLTATLHQAPAFTAADGLDPKDDS